MTTGASQQFLAAIQASPDDDAPRLVYADWLQKRGDLRGEFISIQCRLAGMEIDPDDEARAQLQARQWELFDEHAAAWLAEVGLLPNEGAFHRGFVEEVSVQFARLQAAHELLGQSAVVRELQIFRRPDASSLGHKLLRELLSWEWLRLLRGLNLAENYLGAGAIRILVEAPWFANLTSLELEDNDIGDEGAAALAEARHFGMLRELGLAKNTLVHAPALAQSPALARLSSLDLRKNPLNEDTRALLRRQFGRRVQL
jgi:uncharacterized protein (TIGR02996 family)